MERRFSPCSTMKAKTSPKPAPSSVAGLTM
jgi:hypothetical protein